MSPEGICFISRSEQAAFLQERNHFFLNMGSGKEFVDISALAGTDSASDGRSFALFDYDRDGWQDIVVVNANQPLPIFITTRSPSCREPGLAASSRFVLKAETRQHGLPSFQIATATARWWKLCFQAARN